MVDAKQALMSYFDYQYQMDQLTGFSSSTITGKLMKGDIGGGFQSKAIVPKIQLTDLAFLEFIQRVDLALMQLKSHSSECYGYLYLRYYPQSKGKLSLAEMMGCSDRTCRRLHQKGIAYLESVL